MFWFLLACCVCSAVALAVVDKMELEEACSVCWCGVRLQKLLARSAGDEGPAKVRLGIQRLPVAIGIGCADVVGLVAVCAWMRCSVRSRSFADRFVSRTVSLGLGC